MLNFLTAEKAIDLFAKGVSIAINIIIACSRVKSKK